ncbi:MAG: diguanylate cyclase [Candidatus Omnitrophica bacterium]|nr:diguanylate cyclase [Candidatus Omnitrophota bacterium]
MQDKEKEEVVRNSSSLTQCLSELSARQAKIQITEERLKRLHACFLSFGPDADENIDRLVSLCGEAMGATCALYNCMHADILCSEGKWNTPAGYKDKDKAAGHICYDVISRDNKEPLLVRFLQSTPYVQTDPNVKLYNLETYLGMAVKLGKSNVGSLCVVYQSDFTPTKEDIIFMEIIASAISIEEKHRSLQKECLRSGERYKYISEAATDYIFTVHFKNGKPIRTEHGPRCSVITGYSEKEFDADPLLWLNMVHEEDKPKVLKITQDIIKYKKNQTIEHRIIKKDGTIRWISNEIIVHLAPDGEILYYDGLIKDITERKVPEEALKEKEQFLLSVFKSIQDCISILDKDLNIISVNATAEKWHPHALPLIGKKCYRAYHSRDIPCEFENCPTQRVFKTGKAAYNIVPKSGPGGKAVGWLEIYSFPRFNPVTGKIEGAIEYVRDITERKEAEDKIEKMHSEILKSSHRMKQLVLRDPHTGLYSYSYLEEAIEAEFSRARRYAHPFSVVMLDIDYFKSINDAYGHYFGDIVLKQLARQLKIILRRYDIVVRSGGEEFLIISPGLDRAHALLLANRLMDALSLYNFGNSKQSVKLKLSLAVTSYPEDNISRGMDLVNLASEILNKVKEVGGSRVYSSLDIKSRENHILEKSGKSANIRNLKGKIEKLTLRANQSLKEAIFAFAKTIELKDHYTGEHVEQTVRYATRIANGLKLPKEEVELIKEAAMLHDLGKIGISDQILLKNGKLSTKEFEQIKKHPQIGVDIIRPIHFLHNIIPLIFYHHEKWDGSGYPGGLKGEEIPIGARIIALSDVYQALTSDRPYRKAFSKKEALKIIKEGSGKQFDPQVVDVFLKIIKKEK